MLISDGKVIKILSLMVLDCGIWKVRNISIKSLVSYLSDAEGLRRLSFTKLELAMENWVDYIGVVPEINSSLILPAAITVEGV